MDWGNDGCPFQFNYRRRASRITDGKTGIDTVPEGPYLLVNAPPGTYSVSADYDDAINQQSVRIGGKPLRAVGECLEGATRFYDRVTSTLTGVEKH